MNIFEYKAICEKELAEIEAKVVMAKARLVAIDEIISLGVTIPCEGAQAEEQTEFEPQTAPIDETY